MKEEKIKVIIIERGKEPYVKLIDNELSAMQAIVDGYIESVPFHNYDLICNEEGKLMGLPYTLDLEWDIICGTCFVTKDDEDGEFVSLNDKDMKYLEKLIIDAVVTP